MAPAVIVVPQLKLIPAPRIDAKDAVRLGLIPGFTKGGSK